MIFWIVIFLLSFTLTWLVKNYALKTGLLDIPNYRSSHTKPTPKGGGIAVSISWFIGISYLFLTDGLNKELFFALLSGLPLIIIGFIDDISNVKPLIRIAIHVIVTGAGLFFLGIFENFSIQILFIPIAFLAVIWCINLFNFLDGIDGYIGSEIVFIGVAGFILTGNSIGILLALSVSGFLIWNWPKARIFLGDAGSTLLGYNVAIMAVYFYRTHQTSIIVWIILTSVFWFDASVTMIRRIINKEKIWEAHRKHAYQRIVQAGFSHQKTVLYSMALNILGFCLAFLADKFPERELIFLLMDVLALTVILIRIDKIKPFERDNT